MLCIVDGTGPDEDADYNAALMGGFCRQLEFEFGGRYERGPTTQGSETADIAEKHYRYIVDNYVKGERGSKEDLFLAGFSRGGASVIHLAQLMKKRDLRINGKPVFIKAMFLFDAVDRTTTVDTEEIPNNVITAYHAMRNRDYANYYAEDLERAREEEETCLYGGSGMLYRAAGAHYQQFDMSLGGKDCSNQIERRMKLQKRDKLLRYAMRTETVYLGGGKKGWSIDFDNTGTERAKADAQIRRRANLVSAWFDATHGAMGGAPIRFEEIVALDSKFASAMPSPNDLYLISSDRAAMRQVRAWMWGNIQKEGMRAIASLDPRQNTGF